MEKLLPYAAVVINLFKGVVYEHNREVWNDLIEYEKEVKNHFAGIGIEVYIDESEGYAFLKQPPLEDDEDQVKLPQLIEKRPLSYPVTLLCVLLRKRLLEADGSGGDTRVILSKEQIQDMIKVFLPEQSNEAKLMDKLDTYINKIIQIGFLRKMQQEENLYEINRIIKAKITPEKLQEILEKLKTHAATD